MSKKLLFVPFIAFIVLVVIFLTQLYRNANGNNPTLLQSVMVGRPVPTFQLEDLFQNGKYYTQDILKQGEPVLLNVWASWCPTCYAEHIELNKLAQQGVRIIGMDYKDKRDDAITWLNKSGNPYIHTMFDPTGMVGMDFGVYGTPETFLIDANGIIRYRQVGDVTAENWKTTLGPMYYALVKEADAQAKDAQQ